MERNRSAVLVLLAWLGLIIFSMVTGHFNAPNELQTSWNRFVTATLEAKISGISTFIVFSFLITVSSFLIGVILLPIEIIVFPIMSLVTLNGFWLTGFFVWKYELLFTVIF